MVGEVFASQTDEGLIVYSFFDENSVFGANGSLLLFGKLIPLIVESDGKVILNGSLRVTGKNTGELFLFLLGKLSVKIGFSCRRQSIFGIEPGNEFFSKKLVGSIDVRDVSQS